MDTLVLSDIKPTWETIAFNEGLSEIPCDNKDEWGYNPFRTKDVICFKRGSETGFVFYLPEKEKVFVSDAQSCWSVNLREHFGESFGGHIVFADDYAFDRMGVYETVVGECFVIRKFSVTYSCELVGENKYKCTTDPLSEVCRYVFYDKYFIMEQANHTRSLATVDQLPEREAHDGYIDNMTYDCLRDADDAICQCLYQDFLRNVNISYKKRFIELLRRKYQWNPILTYDSFTEIYKKAMEPKKDLGEIPQRILDDLNRSHVLNSTVKLYKDLTVVMGASNFSYLDVVEQTRAYYDKDRAYFFHKNIISDEWQQDTIDDYIKRNGTICEKLADGDLFKNTCAEKYANYSVEKKIPHARKINLGLMSAQAGYLPVEQAAKMKSPVLDAILEDAYTGRIKKNEMPLAEYLGISGGQLKFFEDLDLPSHMDQFGKYMKDKDFLEYFPDVKKRMFAVSFYLKETSIWDQRWNASKDAVFASAQTLNSIEKIEPQKRRRILQEYSDYLRMLRIYQEYCKKMQDDDPLRQEILAFGEMPINIKPSKIRDYHNRIGRVVDVMQNATQIKNYTAAIENRKQKEAKKREYIGRNYSILMPKDARDIIREGRELQHCVGKAGYIQLMAENKSTILFVRNNKEMEIPLLTLEVRNGAILQCYGFRDSYNDNKEICELLKTYAAEKNLRIECKLYG